MLGWIRHGVLAIMLLGACAVLTGRGKMSRSSTDTGRAILDRLGVGAVVPHSSTIRRYAEAYDPDAVDARDVATWALAQLAQANRHPSAGAAAPDVRPGPTVTVYAITLTARQADPVLLTTGYAGTGP